ncbi:MAG: DUF4328 domain-containing protein [Pseudomonadota bacterium]
MTEQTTSPAPNYFHGNYKDERLPYPDGPRSLLSIARYLGIGLVAFIPLAAVLAAVTAYAATDIQRYWTVILQLSAEESVWITLLGGVDLVYRLSYIVCIILSSWLLFRATRNLQSVAPGRLVTTPHWAWLWFFIPVANFYKPYKAVAEIDRETRRAIGVSQQQSPLLMTWWVCFILSIFLGATNIQLPLANLTQILMVLDVISGILGIVAAVLFFRITRELSELQELLKSTSTASVFD